MEQEGLFLTVEQALNAVCLDFRGYGPQPMLFCQVLRTIHGDDVIVQREPHQSGLWISSPGERRMRWLEGAELAGFMCAQVTRAALAPAQLASVCRQVFQAPCHAARDPATGQPGVWIATGMAAFHCRQCGRCCLKLDYRDGLTAGDMARLHALGRDDILKWVGVSKGPDGRETYRIWVVPGTNQFALPCPFLKRGPSASHWLCRIHEVKPRICRNYPVSRKHARMTGCPGFDKRVPDPVPT